MNQLTLLVAAAITLLAVADIPTTGPSPAYGLNAALTSIVLVKDNVVHGGPRAGLIVASAAKLQQLLDESPNTVIYLMRSRFEVVPNGNNTGIEINSNRSLVLDDDSVIWCNSTLPLPLHLPPAEAKYGPHLVALLGNNTGLKGGHIVDYTVTNASFQATIPVTVGIRILNARDAKVVGVSLSGGWGNAIRIAGMDGATSPPFKPCPKYYGTGCQMHQLPFVQGQAHSPELALSELLLKGQLQPPVSLINNSIVATSVGFRGVWVTWMFGAVVTGNLIRGPLHYGIDLDAMASYCIITNNDVETSLEGKVAMFVEMQCRNNVVTSNRLVAAAGGYGLNLNSFLNSIVSNNLGGSDLKISGVKPYPTALSNRLVDNRNIGRFNAEHAGCGNYASENVVLPSNVDNAMSLEDCTNRPGGCNGPLSIGAGCIDPDGRFDAIRFSDVTPLLPECTSLGGEWMAAGHDKLTVNVSQHGIDVIWAGLEGRPFPQVGESYNGTATIGGTSVTGTLIAKYRHTKGFKVNHYHLVATLQATCNSIEWFRTASSGKRTSFANWTRRASLAPSQPNVVASLKQQLEENLRGRAAVVNAARAIEQRRAVLEQEHALIVRELELLSQMD